MVALSFANSADDVKLLQQHLTSISSQLGSKSKPAIVLKIETKRGFENLPAMLLAAMAAPCCGVMIARGDLAVECGFERLAEVQEEILWLCEAAHVPVIWATQVLESLAKEGLPSRAEISDAAMGTRAECVMLNKGPHIIEAVKALSDILRRMQGHQSKKSSMLRQLNLAQTFLERQ
jgi:pyruvate kinase